MTVRYKPLPEPRSLEELGAIHRAVPEDPTLGDRFERRVLGATELLEVLDSETGATLDQLVPALKDSDGFELRSSDSAEDDIEGRVRRLLGWSLELGRVAKQDERYRRAADGERVE
ncbi:MAG: hypothetical protein BRD21_00910 [Halobacteriales archaeon SW_8_66_22]|nr:MAG: hypothetical protein BRD21_00910 [Halobacteriales archaeon SW_8_66_22]